MCTLFDQIAKEHEAKGRTEGRTEGRVEGRAEEIIDFGREIGLSDNDIIRRLQIKLDVSLQKAQEYFERFSKGTI